MSSEVIPGLAEIFLGGERASEYEHAHSIDAAPWGVRLSEQVTIPSLLLAMRQVVRDRPAVRVYEQGVLTDSVGYGRLLELVELCSQRLRSLRVRAGDRVGLAGPNGLEFCVAALAAMGLGAVVVPINEQESPEAIEYVLSHAGARLVLFSDSLGERVPHGTWARLPFGELSRRVSPDLQVSDATTVAPDDIALIVYTSGTTSRPKGVCLSHYNLCVNADALQRHHRLTPDSVSMCVLPLCFMNAFGFSLITTFRAGACLILCDSPGPSFWKIVSDERVNVVSLVPSLLRLLLLRPRARSQLPTLSHVISAAAPLPTSLALDFHQATAIPILQGYGLTETTNFSTTMPLALDRDRYCALTHSGDQPSIGPALRGCELMVANEQGAELPRGEAGEILIRGHSVMLGYWRDLEANREAFRGGWYHTGDLGYAVDVDGVSHFFIAGRIKELIIRGGRNFAPLAIERELAAVSQLGTFAVTGFDNAHVGEEIGVYVCGEDTAERREQLAVLVGRCSEPSRPRFALLAPEPIPTTRTAKVRRRELAARFAACSGTLGNALVLQFATANDNPRTQQKE